MYAFFLYGPIVEIGMEPYMSGMVMQRLTSRVGRVIEMVVLLQRKKNGSARKRPVGATQQAREGFLLRRERRWRTLIT